ncbi:hypothetical protein SVIOM74S_01316 [Streptomyces violarus]
MDGGHRRRLPGGRRDRVLGLRDGVRAVARRAHGRRGPARLASRGRRGGARSARAARSRPGGRRPAPADPAGHRRLGPGPAAPGRGRDRPSVGDVAGAGRRLGLPGPGVLGDPGRRRRCGRRSGRRREGQQGHSGIRRVLAEARTYIDSPPPLGRVRSSFAPGDARTLRADGPGWSLVARTDDIAFVLLDEEPGEILPVGRGRSCRVSSKPSTRWPYGRTEPVRPRAAPVISASTARLLAGQRVNGPTLAGQRVNGPAPCGWRGAACAAARGPA